MAHFNGQNQLQMLDTAIPKDGLLVTASIYRLLCGKVFIYASAISTADRCEIAEGLPEEDLAAIVDDFHGDEYLRATTGSNPC